MAGSGYTSIHRDKARIGPTCGNGPQGREQAVERGVLVVPGHQHAGAHQFVGILRVELAAHGEGADADEQHQQGQRQGDDDEDREEPFHFRDIVLSWPGVTGFPDHRATSSGGCNLGLFHIFRNHIIGGFADTFDKIINFG